MVAWPLAAQALQRRPVINSFVAYEAISNARKGQYRAEPWLAWLAFWCTHRPAARTREDKSQAVRALAIGSSGDSTILASRVTLLSPAFRSAVHARRFTEASIEAAIGADHNIPGVSSDLGEFLDLEPGRQPQRLQQLG